MVVESHLFYSLSKNCKLPCFALATPPKKEEATFFIIPFLVFMIPLSCRSSFSPISILYRFVRDDNAAFAFDVIVRSTLLFQFRLML